MLSKLKPYLFTFFLIIVLVSVPQVVAQNDTQPIDVILLLDSSLSTAGQRDLIQKAAEFLLDYLEANRFADLDYRLSVVGFNHDVIRNSAISLSRPTEANLAKFFADTPAGGDTDFKLAIEYALNEFSRVNTPGTVRTPIVILMTDGQPARRGQTLPDSELNIYFGNLSQTLTTAVNNAGLQFFVVAVGNAAADQARWQNVLPSEDQYVYIDDNSNLSQVYWQFLSEFMGGEQDAIVELAANGTHTFTVEPFL
jgi:Mg-chelatase subunit ChlD